MFPVFLFLPVSACQIGREATDAAGGFVGSDLSVRRYRAIYICTDLRPKSSVVGLSSHRRPRYSGCCIAHEKA